MICLGIDVGATSTRAVLLDEKGGVLYRRRVFTADQPEPQAWTGWLVRVVQHLLIIEADDNHKIDAIGLALPGLIDADAELVQRSINLPWLEQFPVAKEIEKQLGQVCFLMTDADATTWGEYCAIEPTCTPNRFVHLRFGTGIACGLVKGGAMQSLSPNRTQHLDFLIYDDSSNAILCKCGLHGCLETIASGAAISRLTDQAKLGNTVDELRIAYENKSRAAEDLATRIKQASELVMVKITAQLSPDRIVIGGGVVSRFPALFEPLLNQSSSQAPKTMAGTQTEICQSRSNLSDPRTLPRADIRHSVTMSRKISSTNPLIIKGILGDWAGAIGAALMAKSRQAQRPS